MMIVADIDDCGESQAHHCVGGARAMWFGRHLRLGSLSGTVGVALEFDANYGTMLPIMASIMGALEFDANYGLSTLASL